jgi:DNA-binding GntR family transcriptional regulator
MSEEMKTKKVSQTQKAYKYLKNKIQTCEYIPGQEIYEKQLFEELGYGRTPIREALLTLKKENLIEVFPRKGMIVTHITTKDVNELYQMRKLIDQNIAVEYMSFYSKKDLMEFDKLFKLDSLNKDNSLQAAIDYYLLDIKFHTYLITQANNSFLNKTYKTLMEKQFRLAIFGAKINSTQRQSNYGQHRAIINSILTENEKEIRKNITEHINHSLIESLKTISNDI